MESRLTSNLRKISFSLKYLPLIFLLWAMGCEKPLLQNELESIVSRGELRVITRNNGTCYYEGPLGPVGFEYDLAKAFANHLGVSLRIILIEDDEEMVRTLLRGDADLIAAGFTEGDLSKDVAPGPGYRRVEQMAVGLRDGPRPRNMEELLQSSPWVSAGTPSEKKLKKLASEDSVSGVVVSQQDPEELLEWVWRGIIPLAVLSADVVALNRRFYPELEVHFAFQGGSPLAWAVHPRTRHLQRELNRWFSKPATSELLGQLTQHYYTETSDYVDLMRYHRRIRERLPLYRTFFEEAGKKHQLDWRLIAAQSYQESHWDPLAESFTGVKGIMMITLQTGKDLNVTDRLDPEEAIFAGTRYLAQLHSRVGDQVPEPDRTYMALAAYNVGWHHLQDAGTLAARLGKPPNSWHALRETLPLLRLKTFYSTLPYGYARGNEPVHYVDRIRTYYRILVQYTERGDKPFPAGWPETPVLEPL
jgi:membrane-bound lytic murein transglycosylase F